jgi:2-methylcitrate dehydratase
MTFHQITWDHIDHLHRASIATQLAQFSLGVSYSGLPEDVVGHGKAVLLDAIGRAVRGHAAPERRIGEDVVDELGGTPEAVIIGSGVYASAACAALVNSIAVSSASGSFAANAIPSLLAAGERAKANGRELLAATVVAYELGARYAAAVEGLPGWSLETGAALVVPAAVGKLMHLTDAQIANAIGCCASGSASLSAEDRVAPGDDPSGYLRFGWIAYAAVVACQLASHGFSGPPRVIEGEGGVNAVMFGRRMDLDRLVDLRGWRIRGLQAAGEEANAGSAFQRAVEGILPVQRIEHVVELVRNLEAVDDVGELSRSLVFA